MKIIHISYWFKFLLFIVGFLFTQNTLGQSPGCAALSMPANGSNNVPLDVNFEWVAAARAETYILVVGTSTGGTDILDNIEIGNFTNYNLPNNLPVGQTIFVKIITQNGVGQNLNCAEISFTTTNIPVPDCVGVSFPLNGATDIDVDTPVEWPASANASGYRITIGSLPDANDIVNDLDVLNTTSYQHPGGFDFQTTIYTTITPYNNSGSNYSCSENSFTTDNPLLPGCSAMTFPTNGSTDVSIDALLEWSVSSDANGYRLTIGSFSGGNDIVDDLDVLSVNSYQHPGGFNELSSIFLTITPYNDSGENENCPESEFTIIGGMLPSCTQIINPQNDDEFINVNTEISWIQEATATGYLMTIRKDEPNGDLILDQEDIGNLTTYKPFDFEPRTRYFVTIIPYNNQGTGENCEAINFTTGDPLTLPECTTWIFPENGATEVAQDIVFQWSEVPNTDGFILSIGTSLNGTELLNNEDVGDEVTYNFPDNLPEGTMIYVTINTYRGIEISEDCQMISFQIDGVETENLEIKIPKFFTPNNDGFNDLWMVNSTNEVTVERIFVYNKYGKLLRQLVEGQGWNGIYNGNFLPSDSYWYTVELRNAPSLRGYFLLKR